MVPNVPPIEVLAPFQVTLPVLALNAVAEELLVHAPFIPILNPFEFNMEPELRVRRPVDRQVAGKIDRSAGDREVIEPCG